MLPNFHYTLKLTRVTGWKFSCQKLYSDIWKKNQAFITPQRNKLFNECVAEN